MLDPKLEILELAISPPGDIVMDVLKAADPAAVHAVQARLASTTGQLAHSSGFIVHDIAAAPRNAIPNTTTPQAFARFEAMLLQTFLQSMLPKDTASVYGEGMTGEMWQTMLAEQLGNAMAQHGGIGIADHILGEYYINGEEKVPLQGVSRDASKPERDAQEMLSTALVQELQRKAMQSFKQDRTADSTPATIA